MSHRAPLLLLSTLLVACSAGEAPVSETTPPPPAWPIESTWDPASGRGTIRVTRDDGTVAEIKLHEGFHGYTGGLVLGSHNGPAYRLIDGDVETAVWCAQDESILLSDPDRELTYGWSENVGSGPDGVPLRYLGGAVLEHGPERLILVSENGAAPLHVARWLLVRPDGMLLFRLRIANVGAAAETLSLWTGEDPWVGTYGSAEGDVGWVPGQLVTSERQIDPATRCLGIADPGDDRRARAANVMCLSPSSPDPDRILFANRFAHDGADLDPDVALSGDSMTAFNIGWTDRTLTPGAALEVEYALGGAAWPDPAGTPLPPDLPDETWAPLRAVPAPEHADLDAVSDPLRFASERVEITILPGGEQVEIRGSYRFVNRSDRPLHRRIWFPFAVDDDHPYPTDIELSAGTPRRMKDGIVFTLDIEPSGELVHEIRYRQDAVGGTATYIVTSARAWNQPLDRAELVVTAPDDLTITETSYPMSGPSETLDGARTRSTTIERFFPDREFSVSWR